MYLSEVLIDLRCQRFPMVGIYPFQTEMLPRLKVLGYREVEIRPGSFFPSGMRARGHEYHYSELKEDPYKSNQIENIYSVSIRTGRKMEEGYYYKHCLASYIHLHFGSNPALAEGLVEACRSPEPPPI